jgi:hypothetical protein
LSEATPPFMSNAAQRGFGDALALQVLRQEGYIVVEPVQAFALDGGDTLQYLGGVDLRFCRLGRSYRRPRLVDEFHGGGSTRKRWRTVPGALRVSSPSLSILMIS